VQVRAHACDAPHGAHHFNAILPLRLPANVALAFLLNAARLFGLQGFRSQASQRYF
jgi:hypothetical protein